MKSIESRQNPKIKLARGLRTRKTRDREGLFVVEGLFHLGEALEAGAEMEFVLAAPEALRNDFGSELLTTFEANETQVYEVSSSLLDELSSKDHSSGLMGIAKQAIISIGELKSPISNGFVGLVGAQDPGNVGSVLRSIDAFGLDGLLMLDSGVDVYHPAAVRAGMGAHFWKPLAKGSFDEGVNWAQQAGLEVIGSSAKEGQALNKIRNTDNFLLLLGSEREGLSKEQRSICNQLAKIEMGGRATSLNLAVAAGILMHAIENRNIEKN